MMPLYPRDWRGWLGRAIAVGLFSGFVALAARRMA
jgi:hypothetical protein